MRPAPLHIGLGRRIPHRGCSSAGAVRPPSHRHRRGQEPRVVRPTSSRAARKAAVRWPRDRPPPGAPRPHGIQQSQPSAPRERWQANALARPATPARRSHHAIGQRHVGSRATPRAGERAYAASRQGRDERVVAALMVLVPIGRLLSGSGDARIRCPTREPGVASDAPGRRALSPRRAGAASAPAARRS